MVHFIHIALGIGILISIFFLFRILKAFIHAFKHASMYQSHLRAKVEEEDFEVVEIDEEDVSQ